MSSKALSLMLAAFLILDTSHASSTHRNFVATHKHPSLKRRDGDCRPKVDGHELVFLEDAPRLSVAAAQLEVLHPMLILEDIDDHVESVRCTQTEVVVEFHNHDKAAETADLWNLHDYFTLVTLHSSCRSHEGHAAWNVSQPRLVNLNTISLAAKTSSLKQSAKSVSVEFGEHLDHKLDLRHLAVRQDTSTTASVTASATTLATTLSTPSSTASAASLAYNPTIPAAPASETALSGTLQMGFSYENQRLLPLPEGNIVSNIINIPPGFELWCTNCTLEGSITLEAGWITVQPGSVNLCSTIDVFDGEADVFSDVCDFFSEGYVDFNAQNIGARMEFEIKLLEGFAPLPPLEIPLPTIPLGPITIAGLLNFGPVLESAFLVAASLASNVSVTTGFTLEAPPSVGIHLNISDPLSSSAFGFRESSLSALPFVADTNGLAFAYTAGFTPQVRLAAAAGSGSIEVGAGIGVYLDMPILEGRIEALTQAVDGCQSSNGETAYLLSSNITFGGSGLIVDVEVGSFAAVEVNAAFNNGTGIPLDSQCLKWDAQSGKLADPQLQQKTENSGRANKFNIWAVMATALLTVGFGATIM